MKPGCAAIGMAWLVWIGVGGGMRAEAQVKIGLEVLLEEHLDLIADKRVGLIGNQTSLDAQGRHAAERIGAHARITALFGPEHGFRGNVEDGVTIDASKWKNIPIFSLYGEYREPTPAMLKNVDVLIYDIQDVGVKFYTFISNLFLAMCAAKRDGIPVIVLDRPDPITAAVVEGAVTNPAHAGFVGVIPLPIRYGMTVGELARLFNEEKYAGFSIGADLTVIPMKNYGRTTWYDECGLPWIAPSPNMTTLETAMIYPGTCLVEGTNLSEGRGTDAPFLTLGAPFIEAQKWLEALPEAVRKGVRVEFVDFKPRSIPGMVSKPKYENETCHGLRIHIEDRSVFHPIDFAVALLSAAQKLYPEKFQTRRYLDQLWGNEDLRAMIAEGADYHTILRTTESGVKQFSEVRQKYLMYP